MPTRPTNGVIRRLRQTLYGDGGGLTDGQLLEAFVGGGEEGAFEALLKRHGPMVLGVCRRVLGNAHDAEDAFQATFLVLFRRAAGLRRTGPLGNWLYGVAFRTALEAKSAAAKRRAKEEAKRQMAVPQPLAEDAWREVQAVLDQELSRLPEYYRIPIVLCDLEGKSRKDAARQLGWPIGTVSGRLARGRVLLAKRIARHGISLSGGALAVSLNQYAAAACVPRPLQVATMDAVAAGVVPDRIAALTRGVLKTMLLSKLKIATVGLLGLILTALFTCQVLSGPQKAGAKQAVDGQGPKDAGARPAGQDGEKMVKAGGRVNSLAYAHDGKTAAVVIWKGIPDGDDKSSSLVLWDLQTGKAKRTLDECKEGFFLIRQVAYSKDGKTLAASADGVRTGNAFVEGEIKVWEAQTGALKQTLTYRPWLSCVALSPDGKKVAGGTWADKVFVWDVESGDLVKTLEAKGIQFHSVSFSEDGKQIAAGGGIEKGSKGKVAVWEAETGKLKHTLTDTSMDVVYAVAFSPDGKQVAAGGVDATTRVWDVKTEELMHLLNAHQIWGLAFSPDGKTLATAGMDHKVILWDVAKEKPRRTLQKHGGPVHTVAFSPDGRTLASGSGDGTMRFWSLAPPGESRNPDAKK